jgi:hypothetical protein
LSNLALLGVSSYDGMGSRTRGSCRNGDPHFRLGFPVLPRCGRAPVAIRPNAVHTFGERVVDVRAVDDQRHRSRRRCRRRPADPQLPADPRCCCRAAAIPEQEGRVRHARNPGPGTLNSGAWAPVGALGSVLVVSVRGLWYESHDAKPQHISEGTGRTLLKLSACMNFLGSIKCVLNAHHYLRK